MLGYFLVLFLVTLIKGDNPCLSVLTIDITDGEKLSNNAIKKDGNVFESQNYFVENHRIKGCICNIRKCIRKCCGPGEWMVNGTTICEEPDDYEFNLQIHRKTEQLNDKHDFHLIYNSSFCENDNGLLLPHIYEEDEFFLQENGELFVPKWMKSVHQPHDFCMEVFQNRVVNRTVLALVCLYEEQVQPVVVVGMIISMPFLLATFIAYALLPDRNLHMKALMSYVINLLLGYLLLVIIQLSRSSFSPVSCSTLGYFCIFFFLVSFFWMNVICIDIWLAFSRFRGLSGSKSAERKRFLLYCAYAWGMSILHVVVILIIDKVSNRKAPYAPGIGDGQCFIKSGVAELLYFYGPMGLLITINVALFAATAIKIRNVKKDTAMLKKDDSKRHSYENDKQKFNLYLKLLFAMGVNWSLEIVSWAVNWNLGSVPPYIWYLTDFCNAIYGVFIFFMFVFKKNIWKLLKKRYYSFIGKPHLAHSMTQNPTRTTSYSTAHTSINDRGSTETNTLSTEA